MGYAPRRAESQPKTAGAAIVARYARGRDYHDVLKERCRLLADRIRQIAPEFEGRAFADSAPLAERSLAVAAGLGWIGRNGCLIVPQMGSYVVLAEIICNLKLEPDKPIEHGCGDCDACIRACRTGAILANSLIDGRRCLSYLTVEHRGQIAPELRQRWGSHIFGCDDCQNACPHNRITPPGDSELVQPPRSCAGGPGLLHERELSDLLSWCEGDWHAATDGCATRRATFEMFLRNTILAAAAGGDESLVEPLRQLSDRQPQLGELISWALARLNRDR